MPDETPGMSIVDPKYFADKVAESAEYHERTLEDLEPWTVIVRHMLVEQRSETLAGIIVELRAEGSFFCADRIKKILDALD